MTMPDSNSQMADERAIREVVERWMSATQAGDLDTVLGLMTDDVIFMVPGREPFGKELFCEMSQSMQKMDFNGTNEIRELQVLGNWAFVRCFIDLHITPSGIAPEMHRSGYTLSVFQKGDDGSWRLHRDANLLVTRD